MPHTHVGETQRHRVRRLRRTMTRAETLLWRHLKAHRLNGFGFRRQAPLGRYIVDFVSHACKLVIEVDGGSHDFESRIRHDIQRDAWLGSRGYRIQRFTNDEVLKNLEGVVVAIEQAARRPVDPPPCPSPARGEGTPNQSPE